ncbi:MAG: FAD-dependent oxidoreductase [Rhodospirillales bacterium]|nr:FAD-dependent oxidoreductase [Rhodospirillales bacterium]
MKIAVIGAGVMGLSAAWALARAGHAVTVYEQGPVPNPLGSSVDRHRLIRHPYGAERGYTRMIDPAYAAWETLWTDLGECLYAPTGTLVLQTDGGSWAENSARALADEGVAFRRLETDEVARRFPLIAETGVRYALHLDTGGVLFADRIVAALAAHLARRGVAIHAATAVRDIDPARARARLASGATIAADLLIVAAGPWTNRLVPSLARRMTPSRQIVVYIEPPADLAAAWAAHPMILDIDPDTGFYLVPPRGDAGLKIGNHGFTLQGDPDRERTATPVEAARFMELARPRLRAFERYRRGEAKICFYDVEADERFIVEPVDTAAWAMTGFSGHGFKFAALLGLELARAVAGKRDRVEFIAWAAGRVSA